MKQLPDTAEHWQTITVPQDIERMHIDRNRNHFGQSEGTPFTLDPLKADIGFKGDGYAADLILEGQVQYETADDATKLFIAHLQTRTHETLTGEITMEDIKESSRDGMGTHPHLHQVFIWATIIACGAIRTYKMRSFSKKSLTTRQNSCELQQSF